MRAAAAPILDSVFIRTRRLELGLARTAVQRATSISGRKLHSLEHGLNQGSFRADEIASLADCLGVSPGDLFLTQPTERPPQPNDVRLEAAILHLKKRAHTGTLRHALRMTETEFVEAENALRQRLRPTGATLAFISSGHFRITSRPNVLDKHEIEAIERPDRARDDINVQQARALKRILDGETNQQRFARRGDPGMLMAVGYLEKNRIIRVVEGRYQPTAEVLFNLGLTNMPPRQRQHANAH